DGQHASDGTCGQQDLTANRHEILLPLIGVVPEPSSRPLSLTIAQIFRLLRRDMASSSGLLSIGRKMRFYLGARPSALSIGNAAKVPKYHHRLQRTARFLTSLGPI